MKHSLKWWNADRERWTVWRRSGKVTFKLIEVDPKVRRNSISSICTVSTSPLFGYSIDASNVGSDDNPMLIRSELLKDRRPTIGRHSHTDSFQINSNILDLGVLCEKSVQQQEEMFELIKSYCLKNPVLFNKVVDWGIQNNKDGRISKEEMNNLAKGRVWITAHTVDMGEGEVRLDSLHDIKGAYMEISKGIWKQPDPRTCGAGGQHRLSKNQNGCWVIELQDLDSNRWEKRAYQVEDTQWVDLKNNSIEIRVQIVPMSEILERLDEELLSSKTDVKKNIDFLFTSCNQVKLSQLKGRNLRHHIVNLKVKLEKRYALSFGIQVANTAETISKE